MDELEYFRSITLELQALKNRVRHFIRDKHWLTDGEWKESVLRAVLRRHLPQSIGVGTGFVITQDGPSLANRHSSLRSNSTTSLSGRRFGDHYA
jgi:hypothetical protein